MSVSCFVVADRTAIGTGNFLTSTTPDYRLVCTEEMCGCLTALQSIDKFFAEIDDATQINQHIARNLLGAIRKLEK